MDALRSQRGRKAPTARLPVKPRVSLSENIDVLYTMPVVLLLTMLVVTSMILIQAALHFPYNRTTNNAKLITAHL
jgi:hypothetical protein